MPHAAILCVDDEPVILMSLREQLNRNFGGLYSYECAESAEEAWEVIEELQAQNIQVLAIISDWLMPNVKGDEFLLKVHEQFPGIATIMLSGQADELAIQKVKTTVTFHTFIAKPWDESVLVKSIQMGLKKRRASQA